MRIIVIICMCLTLPSVAVAQSGSILNRVLILLELMGYGDTQTVMANIAINIEPIRRQAERRLRAGDTVVVGYTMSGAEIRATADLGGIIVTPAEAATMGKGLTAGAYPLGSALYALPPAAQLSLFEKDAQLKALDRLATNYWAGIDGSITNILDIRRPDLVAQIVAATAKRDYALAISDIQSTAIGAVNASQIVINARSGASDAAYLKLSEISGGTIAQGMNATLHEAISATAHARSITQNATAAGEKSTRAALNAASNAQSVSGAVVNIVKSQSLDIATIVATAIGAVNGSSISTLP